MNQLNIGIPNHQKTTKVQQGIGDTMEQGKKTIYIEY